MMKELLGNSYLFGGNAPFVEELYEAYLNNPQSVPEEWREYFDSMQVLPGGEGRDVAHAPIVEAFAEGLRSRGVRVATGVFGAHMLVESVNDGPVTIVIDA